MASRRLRFVLPLLAAPLLAQAQSPLVYMQFGSFETQSEAEDRLNQVGKDHAGLLGSVPMGIREVAIAEDLLVYRTQAGPIESRGAAQSMCAQLASNGDACYIVETAIQQARPLAQAAAAPAIAEPVREAAQPLVDETNDVVQATRTGSGLKPLPTQAQAAVNELRAAADAMPLETAAPTDTRDVIPMIRQHSSVSSTRDARNLQTLAQVTGNQQPAPRRAAAPAISTDMEAALADAANAVPQGNPAALPSFQEEEESSFWDAVNPFGGSDEASPQPQATPQERVRAQAERPTLFGDAEAPQAVAEVREDVRKVSDDVQHITHQAEATPFEQAEAAPLAMPTLDSVRQDLPRASIDDIINNNVPTTPKPTVDAGLPLPAPPLPKQVANRLAASSPMQTGAPVNALPVIQTRAVPPAHMPSIPYQQGNTTVTAVLPDGGAVQVEEAQRVPLTDEPIEEAPRRPVVAYASPSGVLAGELPSQSRLNKTVWAQLNYFETAQQALGFWDGFRRTHPDFPVVRVRVTTPYKVLPTAKERYSLRVGPFGNAQFIGTLCDSDPVDDNDLECRSMGDLGLTVNHKLNSRESARPARYGLASKGIEALAGFWVQLGAYPSMGHAEQQWEDMKKEYGMVLSSMKAQVSTPSLGSQARAVYRLRAGPFVNQEAAEELCGRLHDEQASCLVVAENKS